MPVAVECPQGHKRAYMDSSRGHRVNCIYPGCPEQVDVPARITDPCYQTVPLIPRVEGKIGTYSPQLDLNALELFQLTRREMISLTMPPSLLKAWMERGSYSIKGLTRETVGKIVIIEHGRGKRSRGFPNLPDGVYVWVRCDDDAAAHIWDGTMEAAHQEVFDQLHPNITLGASFPAGGPPPCQQRFAYFLLPSDPAENSALPNWSQIARLLAALSQV